MGIEPTWPAWKAGTLPLSYARVPVCRPLNRSKPLFILPKSPEFGEPCRSAAAGPFALIRFYLPQMGEAGFEPAKAEPPDLQSGPFDHSGIPPRSYAPTTPFRAGTYHGIS